VDRAGQRANVAVIWAGVALFEQRRRMLAVASSSFDTCTQHDRSSRYTLWTRAIQFRGDPRNLRPSIAEAMGSAARAEKSALSWTSRFTVF
jgi:hypothetical protein